MDADVVSVGVDICNVPLDKNKKIQLKEGRGHVTSLANGAPPRDNFYPPSLDASTQLRFAASSPIIPFASRQYVNRCCAGVRRGCL